MTTLLDGKRVQFDIEDIKSYEPIWGFLDEQSIRPRPSTSTSLAFTISDMSFVVNGDKVDSLKVKVKKLTTYYGNVFNHLIEDIPDIKLKQKIIGDYFYFYVDTN